MQLPNIVMITFSRSDSVTTVHLATIYQFITPSFELQNSYPRLSPPRQF